MATIIEMPKLSDTMTVGTLVKWLKQVGDDVANGDMLAEVETDKATMEVECFDEGAMLKHYASEGDQVEVGGPIAAIGESGEEAPEVETGGSSQPAAEETVESSREAAPVPDGPASGETQPSGGAAATAGASSGETPGDAPPPPTGKDGERIKASPLARKIAAENGVDLRNVQGSGPGGRIVKDDVLAAASAAAGAAASGGGETPAAEPAPTLEEQELSVSNMRASIAKALVASKTQAPHFYLQMEIDGAPLARLRKDLNAQLAELPAEQGGVKFTVNDLILKAAAEAVRRVPAINRSWGESKIVQHGNVHLAFGVAIEEGLVTPVVRAAETKNLRQIAREAKAFIGKARSKKLTPDEMKGSTLTVTNLGMFGVSDFYGIINPGNAAILSVGATVKRPVVNDNDEIVVGHTMKIGLSGDHRVIDGAVGAQYLQALKEILETPATMLV